MNNKNDEFIEYTDTNGKIWRRLTKDGYFHFSCKINGEFLEVGYMKAYKGRKEQIHESFIG